MKPKPRTFRSFGELLPSFRHDHDRQERKGKKKKGPARKARPPKT